MKFKMKAESTPEEMAPGVTRKVLVYDQNLMMVEVHFKTGAVAALHSHPHQQMSYILSGSFAFENDGEIRVVGEGDSVLLASGASHGVVCKQEGVVLDIFTPMRKDFV